jgi:hypothetical protein
LPGPAKVELWPQSQAADEVLRRQIGGRAARSWAGAFIGPLASHLHRSR